MLIGLLWAFLHHLCDESIPRFTRRHDDLVAMHGHACGPDHRHGLRQTIVSDHDIGAPSQNQSIGVLPDQLHQLRLRVGAFEAGGATKSQGCERRQTHYRRTVARP